MKIEEYDPQKEIADKQSLADYLLGKWEFDISVANTADDEEDYMISKTRYTEAHRDMRDKRRVLEKMGNVQLAVATLTTNKDASGDEETKEEGVEGNGAPPSKRQRLLQLKKYTSKNDRKKLFGGWVPKVQDGDVNQTFSALGMRKVLLEFNADLPPTATFARNRTTGFDIFF